MTDPSRELAAQIADLNRRLHALETAPRAQLTSIGAGGLTVQNGGGITFDDGGALRLGAAGSLDVPNPDGTGTVVGVVNGQRVAPLTVAALQPASFTVGFGGSPAPLVRCYMSLGRDTINGSVSVTDVSGLVDVWLQVSAVGGSHDGTPSGPVNIQTWENISSNTDLSGPWTIPDTLWTPNGHPGGSLVLVEFFGADGTGGSGSATLFVGSNGNLREVIA